MTGDLPRDIAEGWYDIQYQYDQDQEKEEKPMKIYLAAPLFSMAERRFNVRLANSLRRRHEVFLPQEEEQGEPLKGVFESDKGGLDGCDLVVVILDGPDADSGACWEVGYAYGKGKPTIGVRTDFRRGEADGVNLILRYGCSTFLYFQADEELVVVANQILDAIDDLGEGYE